MTRISISQLALILITATQAYVAASSGISGPVAAIIVITCAIVAISSVWSFNNWPPRYRYLASIVITLLALAIFIYASFELVLSVEIADNFSTTSGGIKYVRMQVINDTYHDALCHAYLDDLSRIEVGGGLTRLVTGGEFQLKAANAGDPDNPDAYLISANGGRHYFNIFGVKSDDRTLNVTSKEWEDIDKPILGVGSYLVTVEASGKDCPRRIKSFQINFDGGFDISIGR